MTAAALASATVDLELGEGGGTFGTEAPCESQGAETDDSAPAPTLLTPPPLQPAAAGDPPAPACRICLCSAEDTVGPCFALRELSCACRGDLRLVHPQCAVTWFTTRGTSVCEICKTKAWDMPGLPACAPVAEQRRPPRQAEEATVACGWAADQRVRHAIASLLCSAILSFAVFGAPAIAHSMNRS